MIVLTIAAIFIGITTAGMQNLLPQLREDGSSRSLAILLQRGRLEAMKSHLRVRVATTAGSAVLQSCPSRYGSVGCATGESFTNLVGAVISFGGGDFKGVAFTPPGVPLIFGPDGVPETAATYVFGVDAAATTGSRDVHVTAAGEISRD